jgi:hypothetical protein
MLAPICLFTYCRLSETIQTVTALKENFLASESQLIVFSDGPKDNEISRKKVEAVRAYLRTIEGFKSIEIVESIQNKGLANSIISGVSKVVEKYGKVIVLEDDLLTSKNFLDYMNQSLDFYESNSRVLSISGFSFPECVPTSFPYDVTFGYRASSWGWATWKDRWSVVDWKVSDYELFKKNIFKIIRFNRAGSDLSLMLKRQMHGKLNSWAIRFCYHQFKYEMVDVYPKVSKIKNIGFGMDAENCDLNDFESNLDLSDSRRFIFPLEVKVERSFNRRFRKHNSFKARLNRFLTRKFKK